LLKWALGNYSLMPIGWI